MIFSGYSGFLGSNTDRHDITEILLKVALNTITLTLITTVPVRLKLHETTDIIYIYIVHDDNRFTSFVLCINIYMMVQTSDSVL